MTQATPPSEIPAIVPITLADLRACLRAGWQDFRKAPLFGLFFGLIYVAGGLALVAAYTASGQSWWALLFVAGFPILAPFAATGLYEVSRALECRETPRWGRVIAALRGRGNGQIAAMSAVILVVFMFWVLIGHAVFALFMGMSGMGESWDALLSTNGLAMLAIGSIIGAGFAAFLYCITLVSLPLLLDREVDFITAMITSFACVLRNPVPMIGWAIIIAALLGLAMLPAFAGLLVALPLLGHASWHLYRKLLP